MNSKRLNINQYQLMNICISLLMGIFIYIVYLILVFFKTPFYISISISLVIAGSVYCYIFNIIYLLKRRIDLYSIFIALTIPFFFGRQILYFFNIHPDGKELFRSVITQTAYINTSFYCCIALLSTLIGYLCINHNRYVSKKTPNNYGKNEKNRQALYTIGLIMMAFSLIPFIMDSLSAIKMTFEYGYGYRIVEGSKQSATLISILSGLFLPSVMAMFFSRNPHEKLSIMLLIFYFIAYSFQGSRINTFCYLSLFIYIYYLGNYRIRGKGLLKLIPFIIVFLILFPLISSTRSLTSSYSLLEAINISLKTMENNNIITSILYETGNTFIATAGILNFCPELIPHLGGWSYLCAFIYIIPNFLTKDFVKKFLFTDEAISPFLTNYGGVGSSFVAEGYYNFGYIGGIFIFILIGILWGWLSKKFEEAYAKNKILLLYFIGQLYIVIIFMVRSDLVYRLRGLFWYSIPIIVLSKIYSILVKE